jgi:Carboxypeptidase regulatory-like domain
MRRLVLLLAALSLAVPVALGADTDRVVLAPGLQAAITTPPSYTRTAFDGDSGSWRGPTCVPRGRLDLAGPLSLTWGIGVYRAASAVEAGQQARTFDWRVVEAGTVRLPHVVGARTVGTIPAALVLTSSGAPPGYHEASVAFHLIGVRFFAARAWSRGNDQPCVVDGDGAAEEWHRRVARQALEGIRVEGNLPPARVTARRSGRTVRGSVTDVNGHPLVAAAVVLERKTGSRWRVASRGKTSPRGAFALRLRAPGLQRVRASAAGTTARSRTLRY